MAGPRLLPPELPVLLLLLLLLVVLPTVPLSPGNAAPSPAAAPSHCRPDQFQCAPGDPCYPQDWRCDGHPDCEDDGDEWGCGTATAAEPSAGGLSVTPPRSSAVPPSGSAEPSATPEPEVSVLSGSQGYTWILIVAALLIILVAAGSVAVWVASKAKCRHDTFSLEKASREQLMPDKSQKGSLP